MTRLRAWERVVLAGALAVPQSVAGQVAGVSATPAPPLPAATALAVPFVPQTPALCGGAAVAMVLRYWGERGIFADEFASLVVASREGIRTSDLANAVRQRGWRAEVYAGTHALVREHVGAGWPVIVLVEDRPDRYHYVVVTGWSDGEVRLHDPARGPSRVFDEARFERVWQASGRWAMLVLPDQASAGSAAATVVPEERHGAGRSTRTAHHGTDVCAARIDEAVAHARRGDVATAEHALNAASPACAPESILIERAGLRFREARYAEAIELSTRALATRPSDEYGWDLLASSRYLASDPHGALAAWNRIGRPRNDLTRIDGLRQTRFAIVHDAIGIAPGAVVTPRALARAQRRVTALPTVQRSRVDYRPVRSGDVEVHAAIAERPLLPLGRVELAAHGLRAAIDRTAEIVVAGPTGAGDLWRGSWGWQPDRRTIEFGLSVPAAFGTSFVWGVDATDHIRTFGSGPAVLRERQRTASLSVADWATHTIRWELHGSIEEWSSGQGRVAGLSADVELHDPRDRGMIRAAASGWFSPRHERVYHAARVRASRSSRDAGRAAWHIRVGVDVASAAGPRSHWASAGADHGSDVLLRAHPLLDRRGAVRSTFVAPRLGHGGAELTHRLIDIGAVRIGAAIFTDAAVRGGAASFADFGARTRGAVDAGAGIRLHLPGVAGAIRVDAALGLIDGATAISIGRVPG